jgi:PII-like signaling protein
MDWNTTAGYKHWATLVDGSGERRLRGTTAHRANHGAGTTHGLPGRGIDFFNDKARAIAEMIRVAKPQTKIMIVDETEKVNVSTQGAQQSWEVSWA